LPKNETQKYEKDLFIKVYEDTNPYFYVKGISKNPCFHYLNPCPFSRREG